MIKSNRLCRIMIKDMKTRISKLNIDFDFEAYWEIIYLILLAFFVGMRFLLSTMFTIYWPKYFYRTLTVIGVVLVLLHLMMAKDISKKEIAAMLVVTFVFMMSHYVSGYDFLVDLLILILGAYRVNFRNILKTYIAVWSVLLVVTIIGAMTGLAENLVYYQGEGGERVRMALGICYPTDLAAYVVFLMFAHVCVRDEYITYLEIGVMAALAVAVFYITDARTDFIVMTTLLCMVFAAKRFQKEFYKLLKKQFVWVICMGLPIIFGIVTFGLSKSFSYDNIFLVSLDDKMSGRISLGEWALRDYPIKAFGQYVLEKGAGGSSDISDFYFFIDSSYLSIIIKYGIIFFMVLWIQVVHTAKMVERNKQYFSAIVLIMIFIQSMMEHHYIQYWFNPFILFVFAKYNSVNQITENKQDVFNLN